MLLKKVGLGGGLNAQDSQRERIWDPHGLKKKNRPIIIYLWEISIQLSR